MPDQTADDQNKLTVTSTHTGLEITLEIDRSTGWVALAGHMTVGIMAGDWDGHKILESEALDYLRSWTPEHWRLIVEHLCLCAGCTDESASALLESEAKP